MSPAVDRKTKTLRDFLCVCFWRAVYATSLLKDYITFL